MDEDTTPEKGDNTEAENKDGETDRAVVVTDGDTEMLAEDATDVKPLNDSEESKGSASPTVTKDQD